MPTRSMLMNKQFCFTLHYNVVLCLDEIAIDNFIRNQSSLFSSALSVGLACGEQPSFIIWSWMSLTFFNIDRPTLDET